MAKVYLSSTVLDLRDERQAVSDWLIAAGHLPVHSYVADSETVRDSCLADIDGCDLYVLLLGHRYGYMPEQDNPEGLSITQMEFRRAGELGLPRLAFFRTSVPDINHTDLLHPERNQRLQAFHAEVRQAVRPAEFKDEADLIAALSTGVQRALAAPAGPAAAPCRPTPGPGHATPTPTPRPNPDSGGGWWTTLPGLLTGAAAVITALTGLVALFVSRDEAPPAAPPAPPFQTAPATVAPTAARPAAPAALTAAPALPRVNLAGPAEVSFQKYRPSTYTVLGLESVNRTPTHFGLRVRVRLLTLSNMDMNFWDSGFRLLIDGLPTAPDSNLNELVPGNAFKDADITFPVPMDARRLALRIIHHQSLGETADLPLNIGGTPAAIADAPPAAGGQSVRTGDIGAGARVNIQQNQ